MSKKDAYYFPHFSNARHDRKIKRLRKDLKNEGYAIYFMILEVLRDQLDFRYPIKDLDLLADEFDTSEAIVRTVVHNYDLFAINEDDFFSPKQVLYLQPYIEKTERARKAAEVRWGHANAYANALPEHSKSKANAMQGKERKVKEKKVKESKEERRRIFGETLVPHVPTYGKEMIRHFFNYWTEPMMKGDKLRFEDEKAWSLERRLENWKQRSNQFPNHTTPKPPGFFV